MSKNSSFIEFQLINAEEILELEYHYFAIPNEINGQWIKSACWVTSVMSDSLQPYDYTHQRLLNPLAQRLLGSFMMDRLADQAWTHRLFLRYKKGDNQTFYVMR